MRIQDNLGKLSWSLGDKGLYIMYGLVQLLQIKALSPEVYGVFSLLVALNTWIILISDQSALQGIIQFGVKQDERGRINTFALTLHLTVTIAVTGTIFFIQAPLAHLFGEPQFAYVATMLPLYALITTPRMMALRLLIRDMRLRDLFIVDAIWFGVRAAITFYLLLGGRLNSVEDMVLIDFAGMAASSIAGVVITRKELIFSTEGKLRVIEYIRFGVPLAMATLLNSTPRQLDVLIVQSFFGAAVVGLYNSAKNLYRFFEQAFDAIVSLIYPMAVQYSAQGATEEMRKLVTKMISLSLVPTIIMVASIIGGAGSLIVYILGPQYQPAVGHFSVLSIAALGMPFTLMATVMTAMGYARVVMKYSALGVVVSLGVLFTVGILDLHEFVGLGIVTNSIVVGFLCYTFVRRHVSFPTSMLWRVFGDARSFASERKNNKR